MRKRKQITKNAQGIKVKRCCASCQYKTFNPLDENDNARYCKRREIAVEPCDCCRMWRMSKGLKAAGSISRKTKVKTREYLQYAMPLADSKGVDFTEVRQVYSEYCGAVYMDI